MKINDSLLQIIRRKAHRSFRCAIKRTLGKVQLGKKMEKLSCVLQMNLQDNDLKFDP